jgi:AraC-like DNA-binding protein
VNANRSVAAGLARALFTYALSRGADAQTLMERSGIRSADFAEPDTRVPMPRYLALMSASMALCSDAALALKFGAVLRTEDLSVALSIAGTAGTVGEARSQANRFGRLIHGGQDSEVLQFTRDREGAWLVFSTENGAIAQPIQETGLAWCVRETRRMLESHHGRELFPRAIYFNYEEPSYRSEYDRVFRVPLFFSRDRTAMLVDDGFLALQMPSSNTYVTRVLGEHATQLLKRLDASTTMRGKVESLLIPRLGAGEAAVDLVAKKMGLSRQTLFRKLKSEGVTFEKVLNDLRRDLAVDYLSNGRISVSEVARLLGYSEAAAFSRAFKRWTGVSPRVERGLSRKF